MVPDGISIPSSLFPSVQITDAPAAGLSSGRGRIHPRWGNPLPREKVREGKKQGGLDTRSSLITLLHLLFIKLIVDGTVLEPPVLDAVHGVDARPVVLDG